MMKYDYGKDEYKNFIVAEEKFDKERLGKCESIMYLGNGYMGLRSATEENYFNETRNLFVSGTFNKYSETEVTELPNMPDVTNMLIYIDGERFSLEFGENKEYIRTLNLKNAELERSFIWISPKGKEIKFNFRRFVSLKDLHLIGNYMQVEALNGSFDIEVTTGINSRSTNSGSQHLIEGEKRIYEKKYIQSVQKTNESGIDVVLNTATKACVNNNEIEEPTMFIDRRKVCLTYKAFVEKGKTFTLEKISNIYTSRDIDLENNELNYIREYSLNNIKGEYKKGYKKLAEENKEEWKEKVWDKYKIDIKTNNDIDILSLRFAIYHLTIMTPMHDSRMGIGSKALSGEGYKGHSFWDTEVFTLPFFIYSNQKVARSLLEYRYKGLEGARKKAKENGYEGAMYPWEAAWISDGEVTPVWGEVDIITGKRTKILTGFIEQHITANVANAIWQYYMITNDKNFMDLYGYEIIFDTAIFWNSRMEWNKEKEQFEINDVIGPDEYKEHINNNAYTNYMAYRNIKLALEYCEKLKQGEKDIYNKLNEKLNIENYIQSFKEKLEKLYLPKPNENSIIPQDDTYLSKKVIDLTKYKNQENVGSIFKDYNLEQVNEIQVSKQADIMILFYVLENLFSKDIKIANYNYYEPKTLHDSSLSLSTHCILANDLGHYDVAYDLFKKACEIDLGPNMKTSDAGVHAASLGGIWQCVIMGFAGVRMLDGKLRINPKLPKHWDGLSFNIMWKGNDLKIEIQKDIMTIENNGNQSVEIEVFDNIYKVDNKQIISL